MEFKTKKISGTLLLAVTYPSTTNHFIYNQSLPNHDTASKKLRFEVYELGERIVG
jgi:hypothetical protein